MLHKYLDSSKIYGICQIISDYNSFIIGYKDYYIDIIGIYQKSNYINTNPVKYLNDPETLDKPFLKQLSDDEINLYYTEQFDEDLKNEKEYDDNDAIKVFENIKECIENNI
jgi:hypothetical protein